jgi:acetoacetate decarboxylase
MPLQGWSLPLSPTGAAGLVPPPPWHFSGEVIGIDFVADQAALAATLPEGMAVNEASAATFFFIDWSSASEHDPRTAADPARGQYKEAYVVVPTLLDGKRAARVPYIWVDNDLSLVRGHIQGFPKKLGTIAISRAVSIGRGGPRAEAGATFAGHVASLGQRVAHGTVTLAARADAGTIPSSLRLPIWHTRHVPDLAGGPPLVHDLARNVLTGFECADVWTGPATLGFGTSEFEELAALAPREIIGGFRCSLAFTITGAETRPVGDLS